MDPSTPLIESHPPLLGYVAICQNVRAALEPARAHAISLHDEKGDVLWLSEGSMGPDEHEVVREAMQTFGKPNAAPVLAFDLGEARTAVMARTFDAARVTIGAVMMVMDSRAVTGGAAKLVTPKLRSALQEFAATRQKRSMSPPTLRAAPSPALTRAQKGVAPQIDRLHAALRKSPIALHVQRLIPLSKGSLLKRYEVLLRSKSENAPNAAPQAMLKAAVENGLGSMIDRRVVTQLIGWLVHRPNIWANGAAMFSVNLTRTALHDEHFIKFVELCLAKSQLPQGTIAFEIDAPTAASLANRMKDVAAALNRLGCPIVLDDFEMRTECFALLRLPGVRYVKLASHITAEMRSDKISQAAITAVVQMARVLGMHTVAKRTETPAEQEWLTALGVDFVQSNSMSPPVAIESLQKAPSLKA